MKKKRLLHCRDFFLLLHLHNFQIPVKIICLSDSKNVKITIKKQLHNNTVYLRISNTTAFDSSSLQRFRGRSLPSDHEPDKPTAQSQSAYRPAGCCSLTSPLFAFLKMCVCLCACYSIFVGTLYFRP